MVEKIGEFFETYPIISGLILIAIGFVFLILRVNKNNSFNMNKHRYISWRLLVQTWGAIILFLLMGIIIIIKNI